MNENKIEIEITLPNSVSSHEVAVTFGQNNDGGGSDEPADIPDEFVIAPSASAFGATLVPPTENNDVYEYEHGLYTPADSEDVLEFTEEWGTGIASEDSFKETYQEISQHYRDNVLAE